LKSAGRVNALLVPSRFLNRDKAKVATCSFFLFNAITYQFPW